MQDIATEASQVLWQTRFGVCCGGGGHSFWPALFWPVEICGNGGFFEIRWNIFLETYPLSADLDKLIELRFVTGVESCQTLFHWKMPIVIVSRSLVKKISKFRIPLLSWPVKACLNTWSNKCAACFLAPVSLKGFCSLNFTTPHFPQASLVVDLG